MKASMSQSSSDAIIEKSSAAKKSAKLGQSSYIMSILKRARALLRQVVASFNTDNVLACGEGCYERKHEMVDYVESGKD